MTLLTQTNHLPSEIENEAFWKAHIAKLSTSKITRKEYCRRYNVNYDRFGYWISRLRDESELVPVKLKPSVTHSPTVLCTLKLDNGRSLYIHHQDALSFILERL